MGKSKRIVTCLGIAFLYVLMYLVLRGIVSSTLYEYFTRMTSMFDGLTAQDIVVKMSVPNLLIGDGVIVVAVLLIMRLTKDKGIIGNVGRLSEMFSYISLALVVSMVSAIFVSIFATSGDTTSNVTSQQAVTVGTFPVWMNIIAAGLVAPMAEELVYRYGVQRTLQKCMNPKLAIFLTSFLFGFMHVALVQSIYAFMIGLVFGWCNYKRDSIVPSILMHVTVNMTSVLLALLNMNSAFVMIWLICTFYLCALGCRFVEKTRRK